MGKGGFCQAYGQRWVVIPNFLYITGGDSIPPECPQESTPPPTPMLLSHETRGMPPRNKRRNDFESSVIILPSPVRKECSLYDPLRRNNITPRVSECYHQGMRKLQMKGEKSNGLPRRIVYRSIIGSEGRIPKRPR